MALLLNSPEAVGIAKQKGCVRAILDAFTRCNRSSQLVQLFSQAVELVVRDSDVLQAVRLFSVNVLCFRFTFPDQGIFGPVDTDLGAVGPDILAAAKDKQKSAVTPAALADEATEGMVLLEAVAVSRRLAALILEAGGVTELVRGIATLAFVKGVDTGARSGGGKVAAVRATAKGDAAAGARALSELAQGELMGRASAVVANILRTAGFTERSVARVRRSNSDGGVTGSSSTAAVDDELFTASRRSICAPTVVRALIRAIQVKLSLEAHASAAVRLLGLIACDPKHSGVSLVVELSGVEAAVNVMRSFVDSSSTLISVCAAMLNMAQHEDGAVAVVSRGASRQISRMLQDVATGTGSVAAWGPETPAVLEHLLAVIDLAANTPDSAETLKKQGIVQVIVSVLDSSVVGDSSPAAGLEQQSSDRFEEVRRLVTSILSKLLNMAEVGEASTAVQDTVTRIMAGVGEGPGGGVSRTALSIGTVGLNKLAALCEVPVGRNGGHELWRNASACVTLAVFHFTISRESYRDFCSWYPQQRSWLDPRQFGRACCWAGTILCQYYHRNIHAEEYPGKQETLR